MAKWLRQSTASQEIVIGRMVDATDGNTAETGLTIANTDIDLWKHGATTLADKNSGGGTHIAGGLYSAVLDATDTNTLGNLKIFVQVSGALSWEDSFIVLPAVVFDALVLGTDLLDVSVTQWLGTAAATPTVAGVPEVDVTHWIGTAAATPTVAGVPEVDVTHFGGTAGTFASGVPAVNATQISGDSTAADNLETAFDDTAGAVPWMLISHQGTLQAVGSTTSVTLAATASAEDNVYKGHTFHFVSATTGAKQSALCTAYVGSTKVATLDPALSVALTGTVVYKAAATAPSSGSAGGLDAAGVRAAIGLGSANLDTQLSTIDTVVDSILVDTAEIGAAGAGLTALATQASVNTIDDLLDTEVAAIISSLSTIAGYLDTEVTAILNALTANRAEPGQGAPGASISAVAKIDYLYKAFRNRKTQTATEFAIYADDGTTKDHEAAVSSDGTTLVVGELTTGA